VKKLLVVVLLLAGCGFAGSQGYDWVNYQVQTPTSTRSQPVNIHIAEGESPDEIAQDLQAKGLIRNKDVFVYYLRYTGARSRLQAGDFTLDRNMSMAQITDVLQHSRPSQLSIRLPEGYTVQLMAQEAQKAGLGTAAEYIAAAREQGWQYDFLKERPAGSTLEGFLFPDSYQLDRSAGVHDLIKRQLDRFAEVFTPDMRAQASQKGVSVYALVTMASMVEREVNRDPDRGRVCSVFYNRLSRGQNLEVDATVLYGLGKWHETVTAADLARDTPYNTYLHAGLPPGPISNPGLAAMTACLAPESTNYIHYFTDPRGTTHFASSDAEFEQQKRQFGVAFQ
jgi:UPF0755 protein